MGDAQIAEGGRFAHDDGEDGRQTGSIGERGREVGGITIGEQQNAREGLGCETLPDAVEGVTEVGAGAGEIECGEVADPTEFIVEQVGSHLKL